MGAYLATPPLPWANNVGGTIILRDKYVSLQDIIDGAVVFQIQDNHGSVSNAAVVQYPSDQKYYLQASGSMLWQLGDISQAVNRIELIATGNIPQGFSIVDVKLPSPTGYLITVETEDGEVPQVGIAYDVLVVKFSDDFPNSGDYHESSSNDFECFDYIKATAQNQGSITLWKQWKITTIDVVDTVPGESFFVQDDDSPIAIPEGAKFNFYPKYR